MSLILNIERLAELPVTLSPSTMYIIKASDPALVDLYFTNTDGTEVRHVVNSSDIAKIVSDAVGSASDIMVVANNAAMNALRPTRTIMVLSLDASADPTVNSGAALYVFNATTTSWVKVADFQSMDVVLKWDNIEGRPISSPHDIDGAVAISHGHANKSELDLIGVDSKDNFMFNGQYIQVPLLAEEW